MGKSEQATEDLPPQNGGGGESCSSRGEKRQSKKSPEKGGEGEYSCGEEDVPLIVLGTREKEGGFPLPWSREHIKKGGENLKRE